MVENGYATYVNGSRYEQNASEDDRDDSHASNIASYFQALFKWDQLSPLDVALE